MFSRIRDSIVHVAGIIQYRHDALYKAWGYMLFFALLSITGPLIRVVTNETLSPSERDAIREAGKPSAHACALADATLTCDQETLETLITLDNVNLILDSHATLQKEELSMSAFHLVIHQDTLYLVFFNQVLFSKPIADLHEEMHQLDFAYTEETEGTYYRALYAAMHQEIRILRPLRMGYVGISTLIYSIFLFNVIILINTFLSRSRLQAVPFIEMYVMMSYAATLLYVVIIFESMFRFDFFIFLILLLVAFRQMSKLTFEIQKRIRVK